MTSPMPSTGARVGRGAVAVAGLLAVWILCWGDLSAANVLGGLAVSVAVLAVFPLGIPERHGHTLRPIPTARLVGFFVVELVRSNLAMARDLLSRRGRIRTGVLHYRLRVDSEGLLTFLANVTSLTPGTMPIEIDDEHHVLVLHLTRSYERERVRATVARYEELALAAFGSRVELAQLARASVAGAGSGERR
jgi:multicomponent Na+:H+ antiporter subunit E